MLRLVVFVLLIFSSIIGLADTNCAAQLTAITPATKEQLGDFPDWVAVHAKREKDEIYISGYIENMFVADINSDGKNEFIIQTSEGSGLLSGIFVWFFAKQDKGYALLGTIGTNAQDGDYWYSTSFFNEFTHQNELLVRLCGKTYITFDKDVEGNPTRAVFDWQKEDEIICNADWVTVHRDYFKKLYDAKLYQQAFSYLQAALDNCNSVVDAKTRLWIKNDLALSAYKKGDPLLCKQYVDEIKSDSAFKSATPTLVNSVNYNGQICMTQQAYEEKRGNAGQYDYSWLLKPGLVLSKSDPNYDLLLSAVVPNTKSDPESLRAFLGEMSDIDPSPKITNQRYVTIELVGTGRETPWDAMIWVDVKSSRSGVIALTPADSSIPQHFIAASRSMTKETLAKEFMLAVNNWLNQHRGKDGQLINTYLANHDPVDGEKINFYDYQGKERVDILPLLKKL